MTNFLFADECPLIIEDLCTIPIINPVFKDRQTLKLKLPNGLEAYIISDPETESSGAVLTVKAGSWDEPDEFPGLAHFLEHMLFLGTEKYPIESDYDRFIKEHHGQTNAYTTTDHTLYLFSISPSKFEEALDRFSSFFKKPLFNPSGVSRELKAVDQEFYKNIQNDSIRITYVLKELANKNHNFSRFNAGNLETLSNVSRETLIDWYQQNYSAEQMKLIVYGSQSLEILKNWVIEDFNDIPQINRTIQKTETSIFGEELENKMVYIKTLKDVHTLRLIWEIPNYFRTHETSQPEHLIGTVLGHEGEGGLFASLKSDKLVEKLAAGADYIAENNMVFYLNIQLTEHGIHQINQVIERAFQAIQLLKTKEFPRYVHEELQKMQLARYQFQSQKNTFSQLMRFGSLLVYERLSTFPERCVITPELNEEEVKDFLNHLTPQKAVFLFASQLPDVEFDQMETWLKVPYKIVPLDSEVMKTWMNPIENLSLHLPEPNPFIPKSLKLVDIDDEETNTKLPHPTLLVDTTKAKVYYALDKYFRTPHTQWFFEIKTPSINSNDSLKMVMGDLYISSVKHSLSKFTYPAELADLVYRISRSSNGISCSIQGYQENAEILFEMILKHLKTCQPTEAQFNLFKNSLLRKYRNFKEEGPIHEAFEVYTQIIYESFTTQLEKAQAIETVSYSSFLEYLEHMYDQTFIEALFYGCVEKDHCYKMYQNMESVLNSVEYPEKERDPEKIVVLPEDKATLHIEISANSASHAAILGIEDPVFSFKARAAQQILAQALKSAFFDTLRTKQQTGYLVFSSAEEIKKHLFFNFAVQSATHDPQELIVRFELFLENFLREMDKNGLTIEGFENIRRSLIHSIKNQPQNLFETGGLLNILAFDCDADFDWMNKRLAGLEELTYEEFLEFAEQFIGKSNQRRFAITARGTQTPNRGYTKFESPLAFKQICSYQNKNK